MSPEQRRAQDVMSMMLPLLAGKRTSKEDLRVAVVAIRDQLDLLIRALDGDPTACVDARAIGSGLEDKTINELQSILKNKLMK